VKRLAVPILCAVFFVSGAGALVFESLWFRQAGLAFGNSVWASTLVLSSFMAGMALGSMLVVRFGSAIRHPVRLYARLEMTVGLTGAVLVFVLPSLGRLLAPLLAALNEEPVVLNSVRFALGFLLLVLPATAMGATLPVLVKALRVWDPDFGAVLGRLYGFNTLGAVLGALAAELLLVTHFGVRGAALAAASLYLAAALVALAIHRAFAGAETASGAPAVEASEIEDAKGWLRPGTIAASSFLAGFVLLAFEVVWFRFVRLFIDPNPRAFSLMLAVVLSGIGLGGFLAGLALRRFPRADRLAAAVACLAGAVAVLLYRGFPAVLAPVEHVYIQGVAEVLRLSTMLMAPVALLSGILFTFTGAALHRELASDVRATGLLALANTVGGMFGSIAGAFLLLPKLGIEGSFFALASVYIGVAALLLAVRVEGRALWIRGAQGCAALALASALVGFPSGAMQKHYLPTLASRYGYPDFASIEAVREGRSQTVVYLRTETGHEPAYQRLVTGSFSMASNQVLDRRYMKLFVYWPLALAPHSKRALLVSYGVGNTAKALTDSAGLSHIDVVDISRAVTEMSHIAFPDPKSHPLHDPRVALHIEDGRYFLQTTEQRYDLITSEPPPPKHAGVVNLYTREYFQLIYDRLTDGGINTYWLPVHLLTRNETRAIIRAYCDVFRNCSLWGGFGYSWMLAGARNPTWGVSEQAFSAQWRDPVVAPELATLGVEVPEQLGALFMADARGLAQITGNVPPVTDNFPKRLTDEVTKPADFRWYRSLMDPSANARAFAQSAFIRKAWPAGLRKRTLAYFPYQDMIDTQLGMRARLLPIDARLRALHRIQTRTPLRTLALWLLGLKGDFGRDSADPAVRAARALAERDYAGARQLYLEALRLAPGNPELPRLASYALCMDEGLARLGVARSRCGALPRLVQTR